MLLVMLGKKRLISHRNVQTRRTKNSREGFGSRTRGTGPCRVVCVKERERGYRGEEGISGYAQLFPDVQELQGVDLKVPHHKPLLK